MASLLQIECSVCYFPMGTERLPMVLHCGHVYCKICVSGKLEKRAGKNATLKCPFCGRVSKYENELPIVYAMVDICDSIQKHVHGLKICSNCSEVLSGPCFCQSCYANGKLTASSSSSNKRESKGVNTDVQINSKYAYGSCLNDSKSIGRPKSRENGEQTECIDLTNDD